MKNASPRQIVLWASLLICALCFTLELASYFIPVLHFREFDLFVIPFLLLIFSFIIIYVSVENFIYRKIKLIYKHISSVKSTKELTDQTVDMSKDLVAEVNDEVEKWAMSSSREIDELKKLAEYRKEFVGNIYHELKTPVTSIQGYLDTLIEGGLYDDRINKDYLEKAMRNVERMAEIINDLESIAHLESGELQLNYVKFDVCELTKEVFEMLEMQAEQKNIQMRIKEGLDDVYNVYADEKLIREVLVNLIGNSLKYGKENGLTQVGFYDMGENILIEVADDGVGIEKEYLNRVFERFFRIEKSRSRHNGGTGLGLAIVKHIMEAHHQAVHVRSTPDAGSTFGFTLKKYR